MKRTILVLCVLSAACIDLTASDSSRPSTSLTGTWTGVLEIDGPIEQLEIRIEQPEPGYTRSKEFSGIATTTVGGNARTYQVHGKLLTRYMKARIEIPDRNLTLVGDISHTYRDTQIHGWCFDDVKSGEFTIHRPLPDYEYAS